jgi:hypothetical protein
MVNILITGKVTKSPISTPVNVEFTLSPRLPAVGNTLSGTFILPFVDLPEQLLEVFSQTVDFPFPSPETLPTEEIQGRITHQHSEEKA